MRYNNKKPFECPFCGPVENTKWECPNCGCTDKGGLKLKSEYSFHVRSSKNQRLLKQTDKLAQRMAKKFGYDVFTGDDVTSAGEKHFSTIKPMQPLYDVPNAAPYTQSRYPYPEQVPGHFWNGSTTKVSPPIPNVPSININSLDDSIVNNNLNNLPNPPKYNVLARYNKLTK